MKPPPTPPEGERTVMREWFKVQSSRFKKRLFVEGLKVNTLKLLYDTTYLKESHSQAFKALTIGQGN